MLVLYSYLPISLLISLLISGYTAINTIICIKSVGIHKEQVLHKRHVQAVSVGLWDCIYKLCQAIC